MRRRSLRLIALIAVALPNAAARTPTAVFRDTSGAIRLIEYGSMITSSAGGALASDPAAAQDSAGNTVVVALDSWNGIGLNVYYAASRTWRGWTHSGGGPFQGMPAVAVVASGIVFVVARDSWNTYWLGNWTPTYGWGSWLYLAGVFSTDPAMTAAPDGYVYIVGKDNWNSVWSGRYVVGIGFSGWYWGGGVVAGKPSVTAGSDNATYIAVRDSWGGVWAASVSGTTWSTWSFGGGYTNGDPGVAATAGWIHVVIPGPSNIVHHRRFTAGGWDPAGWNSTDGVAIGPSPAAEFAAQELYVAGQDCASANALWWHKYKKDPTPSFSLWSRTESTGPVAGKLAAAPRW